MRARSLVAFTLLAQMGVGAYWTLGMLFVWTWCQAGPAVAHQLTALGWPTIGPVMGISMVASLFHLGSPTNAWRAFGNLRRSWLSREILFATLFAGGSVLLAAMQWSDLDTPAVLGIVGIVTGIVGLALIGSMGNTYRLRTVPAWNSRATTVSFFATTFLLGALAVGAMLASQAAAGDVWAHIANQWIALWAIVLLGIDLSIVSLWLAQLSGSAAAMYSTFRITQVYRVAFRIKLVLSVAGIVVFGLVLLPIWEGCPSIQGLVMLLACCFAAISATLGRSLFYIARVRYGV